MIQNLPLNPVSKSATIPTSDTVHQERHDCGRLLIVVKKDGIELACPKCGGEGTIHMATDTDNATDGVVVSPYGLIFKAELTPPEPFTVDVKPEVIDYIIKQATHDAYCSDMTRGRFRFTKKDVHSIAKYYCEMQGVPISAMDFLLKD